MELIGADAAGAHLARLQAFGGDDHLKDIATSVAMKEAISSWMNEARPPSLGELILSDAVVPGKIFTLYINWFFKGLSEVDKAQRRGVQHPPPALAYAKLDAFRLGLRVECPFHAEHLTAGSSWSELKGQATKFILALITGVEGEVIRAVPYVIANLAPNLFRPASLIGHHWNTRLQVFAEEIETFSAMRSIEPPRRRSDLDALRDIPESGTGGGGDRHALTTPKPKVRYAAVKGEFLNSTVPSLLPRRMIDRMLGKRLGLLPG